jgi:hypothetical protein
MRVELSIGNVIIIGLAAFLMIPGVLLASKYAAQSNIPVLSDIGSGAVTIWRVAA